MFHDNLPTRDARLGIVGRSRDAVVHADASGLTIGGQGAERVELVLSGAPRLRARVGARRVEILLGDDQVLRAVVEDLPAFVTRVESGFRSAAMNFLPFLLALLLAALILAVQPFQAAGAVVVTAAFSIVASWLLDTSPFASRVTVDARGVLVERRGRKRFVSYGQIREVALDPDPARGGLRFALHDGRAMAVRTALYVGGARDGGQHRAARALLAQIQVRLEAYRAAERDALLTEELARGDGTREAWLARVRALDGRGYRDGAIPDEHLWRVIEDPAADPTARAAALAALRRRLDDAGRERVRVATAAVPEPRLRVALEATLEANDEADLDAALVAASEIDLAD